MVYNIFPASKELQGIVKQYIEVCSADKIELLLFLPNGCNFIVFNRGVDCYAKEHNGDKKFPIPKKYSVSTKANGVRQIILNREKSFKDVDLPIILAELTPIGFYKLFNMDASILNGTYLEIEDDIVKRYFKELYTHDSVDKEFEYLNSSLSRLESSQNNTRLPLEDVLDKIADSYRFEVRVESLVKEFGYSRSTMERNFKKIIGLTPKNFIFVSKFCKTVLAYIEDDCTFKDLEYLYSDSSHMNVVFKKFFGVNPSLILNEVANNRMHIYQMKRLKSS